MYKSKIYCYLRGGLRLFKGLCSLLLPNAPGAMFIKGGMLILDSRVDVACDRGIAD